MEVHFGAYMGLRNFSLCNCPPKYIIYSVCMFWYILLIKCYNLYKVLACSTPFFQLSLFCATFFQLLMFMLFISSKTSSSQRVLGLPIGLLGMGFHLLIFCTILSSAMRSVLVYSSTFSMEICVKKYQGMGFMVMALRSKRVGNNYLKQIPNLYLPFMRHSVCD